MPPPDYIPGSRGKRLCYEASPPTLVSLLLTTNSPRRQEQSIAHVVGQCAEMGVVEITFCMNAASHVTPSSSSLNVEWFSGCALDRFFLRNMTDSYNLIDIYLLI